MWAWPRYISHSKMLSTQDLAENSKSARSVMEEFETHLGFRLSQLMFEGPEEELTLTVNAQPAIVAHSLMALAAVKVNYYLHPGSPLKEVLGVDDTSKLAAYVMGHSIGEFSALVCASSITVADAARITVTLPNILAKR